MKRSARGSLLLAATAAASALVAVDFAAADSTWIGGGGNQYMDNPANWDNGVPTGEIANFGPVNVNTSAESDMGVSFLGMNIDNSGAGSWSITRSGNDGNPRSVTLGSAGLTATGSGTITWGAFNTIISANQTWNIASGLTLAHENIAQLTFTGTMTKAGAGTLVLGSGGLGSGGIVVSEGTLASTRGTSPVGTGGITLNSGTTFESRGVLINNAPLYVSSNTTIRSLGSGAGLDTASIINLLDNGGTVTLTTGASATDSFRMRNYVVGGDNTNVIQVEGSGTLSLEGGTTAANGFNGKWRIMSGTVRLFDINGLGNRGAVHSNTTVANPTQIELAGGTIAAGGTASTSTTINFNNPINVTGDASILIAMNSQPFGTTAISGVSRRFGALTIGASTLSIGLFNVSPFNVTGPSGASATQIGFTTATLLDNATFDVAGTPSTVGLNIASPMAGTGFGFTKTGGGIMNLGGVNTFTGGVTVDGGTLNFGSATGVSARNLVVNAGTLSLNNGAASNYTLTNKTISGSGLVTIGGSTSATLALAGSTIAPGTFGTSAILSLTATASGTRRIDFNSASGTRTSLVMDIAPGYVAGTSYDQITVSATQIGATSGVGNLSNTNLVLVVDPSLTIANFADGESMVLINAPGINFTTTTFGSTSIPTYWQTRSSISYNDGSVTLNFVPEPSSLTLLGLAGLGLMRRRRRA